MGRPTQGYYNAAGDKLPGTAIQRFNRSVAVDHNGCWIWQAARMHGRNYGKFWLYGKTVQAHRASWLLYVGPIPRGMFVCHRCDVEACVNPAHLFLGSAKDNTEDMIAKGRNAVRRGERSNLAKLSEGQVAAIRKATGSQRAIAKQFGISQSAVSLIKRGINWRHTHG